MVELYESKISQTEDLTDIADFLTEDPQYKKSVLKYIESTVKTLQSLLRTTLIFYVAQKLISRLKRLKKSPLILVFLQIMKCVFLLELNIFCEKI